jgi:hypothetical protein
MFRYLSPIALTLWATCSTAAIQNSDFWFHNDGDIVFIDGQRGAPLHIDYIGPPLTKPLTVRIKPKNPKLKISPPTCTFTKKDDDCRLIVQLKKQGQKVYGVNQFTVTEEGASHGVLNPQAASDESTVGFGVGVQGKDMPKPIYVILDNSTRWENTVGGAVIINATKEKRNYIISLWERPSTSSSYFDSREFSLPPESICYPDIDLARNIRNITQKDISIPGWLSARNYGPKISDITNPSDPIYNSFSLDRNANISSCSAIGRNGDKCASNKWGSMAVGLANLGSEDMEGGIRAGQIEILRDNSWGNKAYIYYSGYWNSNSLALLQIQGSTDGSENWDVKAATPSILEIKSAPPCSDYIKGDPSVTLAVRLKIFGPGSVTMPAGAQCQKYRTPGEDFTYCTGSGLKDTFYEITAVPEAGKTFKGWGSDGLCDDSKTTCRIQLTKDVSLKPFFW